MSPKRIMIFLIVVFLLLFGCRVQRQAIPSYQYFIVDSVYGSNVYTFVIKDPNPRVEHIFPTGATDYPINYDHYVRIYYKQDSVDWIKNDTLILVKKKSNSKGRIELQTTMQQEEFMAQVVEVEAVQ